MTAIRGSKYQPDGKLRHPWSRVLGRLLHHHVGVAFNPFPYDLIMAMPSFKEQPRDEHMAAILHFAREDDERSQYPWEPYDDRSVLQTSPLPGSNVENPRWRDRWERMNQLPEHLELRHPEQIEGRSILVADDVFTTGIGLTVLARWLKRQGAAHVDGVVLFRST